MDIIKNERLYCAHYKSLNDPFEGLFSTIELRNIGALKIGGGGISISGGLSIGGGGISVGGRRKKTSYTTIDQLPALKIPPLICSLSSSMADVRMWSLYASGHIGCAIEIDLEPDGKNIVEMKYDTGLQHFKSQLTNNTRAVDILSFKTHHWSYEKEYRIFNEQKFYPISGKITGIYLGIRVKEEHKESVGRFAPKGIPIYTTDINEEDVKITNKAQIN